MPLFKKKFKDTAISKFLRDKAPNILEAVGKRFPTIGLISDLIQKDEKLTPEEKATALEMAKIELQHEHEITERWSLDSHSESWLSRNCRPIILLSTFAMYFTFIILDSCGINFEITETWKDSFDGTVKMVGGAYFLFKTAERFRR